MEAVRCASPICFVFQGAHFGCANQVQLIWLISAHSSGSAQRTWFFFRFQTECHNLDE